MSSESRQVISVINQRLDCLDLAQRSFVAVMLQKNLIIPHSLRALILELILARDFVIKVRPVHMALCRLYEMRGQMSDSARGADMDLLVSSNAVEQALGALKFIADLQTLVAVSGEIVELLRQPRENISSHSYI